MNLETKSAPAPSPLLVREQRAYTPNIVLRRASAKEWEGTPGVWSITLDDAVIERANIGIDITSLPAGYGVVGGAARNVLEAVVHPSTQLPQPRDIDAKFFSEQGGKRLDDSQEYELSMALSPRDTENGHGISEVSSIKKWLRSCDFTLNQSIVCDRMLHTTTNAVADMLTYAIRPTSYEHNSEHRLGMKLALKAIRLLAELRVDGVEEAAIRGINLRYDAFIDDRSYGFWHVLNLDKALERGPDIATEYVHQLRRHGLLSRQEARGGVDAIYERMLDEVYWFEPSAGAQETLREMKKSWLRRPLQQRIGDYVLHAKK